MFNADQLSQIGHHNGVQTATNQTGGQANNVGFKFEPKHKKLSDFTCLCTKRV